MPLCSVASDSNVKNRFKTKYTRPAIIQVRECREITQLIEAEMMCDNCDNNAVAQGRCFDCEKYMCSDCITAHIRIPFLRDHQLMSLDEIKNKGIPVVERLGEYIKTASATKAKLEASVKTIEEEEMRVTSENVEVKKQIDEVFNKYMQALEEKRERLKQESSAMTAIKMQNLSSQKDSLLMHLACLASAIQFTENVLAKGSYSEVLSMSTDVTSRLSSLSSKPFDGDVKEQYNKVTFYVDGKVQQILSDSIEMFARMTDVNGLPDPQQCEVVWPDNVPGCFIIIKNRFGELIDIDQKRITNGRFGVCGDLQPSEKGVWKITNENIHKQGCGCSGIHNPSPVFVEGQLIKNGILSICSY